MTESQGKPFFQTIIFSALRACVALFSPHVKCLSNALRSLRQPQAKDFSQDSARGSPPLESTIFGS